MSRAKSRKRVTSFLQKTYEIVNDGNNAAVVSWTQDGLGFVIKRVAEFTEEVLPRYFKHSNFASFVRQLNMYDFHKSREEGSENVFRHQFFAKEKPNLLRRIQRKSSDLPADTMEKADCQRLLTKVKQLQTQHQLLEQTVQLLRDENRDILVCNRDLLDEVSAYKVREEKLEALLHTFSAQLQAFTEVPEVLEPHFPELLPEVEFELEPRS